MAAVTICSDFGAQKDKVWHCLHCFPIYFPWSDGTSAMIFIFWMWSFKPAFSLSTFTFIKRLFSTSSLSAIRVVSSVYLKLLIFLLAILIPACDSSSPAFHVMYSAYKQGNNIYSLDLLLSQFWASQLFHIRICCILTPYQFLRRQVRQSGWYSHL